MDVSLLIARRLSLKSDDASQNTRRRSPAVGIAVTGIALSVTIMLLTLAIVPGFKHQITEKVFGFDAQISLHPVQPVVSYDAGNRVAVECSDSLRDRLLSHLPDGARVQLSASIPGILKTDDQFAGLVFKAFDDGLEGSIIDSCIEDGGIPDYDVEEMRYAIVVSRTTADALQLSRGDKVNAYFFVDNNLKSRRFTVAGIYNSHFNEYDKLMAYASMPALRSIAGLPDGAGNEIEIRGLDRDIISDTRLVMQQVASDAFYDGTAGCYLAVSDVFEKDPMYFNWLDLLDTNVIVILVLMGCVAAVTLISCLVIMILERVTLIGTLKSLGATNGLIERMFLFMAQRIVLRGIILGDLIGLLLVWLQWQFALLPLDPEAYYLNSVPVEFNWTGIILLNIGAVVLSLAIMLIPAHMVSRISPAKVMRFE